MRWRRRGRRWRERPPAASRAGVARTRPTACRRGTVGGRSTAPAAPAGASGSRTCTLLAPNRGPNDLRRGPAARAQSGPSSPAFVLVGPDDPLHQRVADDIVLVE